MRRKKKTYPDHEEIASFQKEKHVHKFRGMTKVEVIMEKIREYRQRQIRREYPSSQLLDIVEI